MSASLEKSVTKTRVRFNVIGVTRGWVGVKFPGKKCYVTLENGPFRLAALPVSLIVLLKTFQKQIAVSRNFTVELAHVYRPGRPYTHTGKS